MADGAGRSRHWDTSPPDRDPAVSTLDTRGAFANQDSNMIMKNTKAGQMKQSLDRPETEQSQSNEIDDTLDTGGSGTM